MKSSVYKVIGNPGSLEYREISWHSTKREAVAEAKRKNKEEADKRGVSLEQYLDGIELHGRFHVFKSGFDGHRAE